jgi:hypothetical protein
MHRWGHDASLGKVLLLHLRKLASQSRRSAVTKMLRRGKRNLSGTTLTHVPLLAPALESTTQKSFSVGTS